MIYQCCDILGGVHSSTLSIRVCAAKRPPYGGISLSQRVCFLGILSHKGYTLSAFLSHKRVCFFSKICSKAAFAKTIFKKSSTAMFHAENPQNISLSQRVWFLQISLSQRAPFWTWMPHIPTTFWPECLPPTTGKDICSDNSHGLYFTQLL